MCVACDDWILSNSIFVLAASDAMYILINRSNKYDHINYIEHP